MAMLGYCQSAALATVAEMAQVFKDAYGTLFLVCHSSYGLTINGKLLTDCSLRLSHGATPTVQRVEIASGKGCA